VRGGVVAAGRVGVRTAVGLAGCAARAGVAVTGSAVGVRGTVLVADGGVAPRVAAAFGTTLGGDAANWQPPRRAVASAIHKTCLRATTLYHPASRFGAPRARGGVR
jgi:hypothetical protein